MDIRSFVYKYKKPILLLLSILIYIAIILLAIGNIYSIIKYGIEFLFWVLLSLSVLGVSFLFVAMIYDTLNKKF